MRLVRFYLYVVRIIMLNMESPQGEEAAKRIGVDYAETSAKTGEGIRRLFYRAVIRTVPLEMIKLGSGGCIIL